MDEKKPLPYPKVWGGFGMVGEHKLAALDRVDTPYLTGMQQNSVSYKRGQFREVVVSDNPVDGIFCLGQIQAGIDANAPSYVSGSYNGTTFKNRGQFFTNVDFVTPNIRMLGAGRGYVIDTTQSPGIQDALLNDLYVTNNGKTFRKWWSFSASVPPFFEYNTRIGGQYYEASYCVGATNGAWCWVLPTTYVRIVLDSPQPTGHVDNYYGTWTPRCLRAEGSALMTDGTMVGIAGQRHGVPLGGRASPYHLVAMQPFYYTPGAGNGGPQPAIVVSANNGRDWAGTDYGTFMDNIVESVIEGSPVVDFNRAVTVATETFAVYPFDTHYCFVMAVSMKVAVPPAIGRPTYVGRLSLDTYSIDQIHQIEVPKNPTETKYLVRISEEYCDGWYMFIYADADDPNAAAKLYRTQDFFTWQSFPTPFTGASVGAMVGFDQHTIWVSAYVGGGTYAVYETKDAGVTWKRRSNLRTGTPADPNTDVGLQRFGVISILRKNGGPTRIRPTQPWVCDARISP